MKDALLHLMLVILLLTGCEATPSEIPSTSTNSSPIGEVANGSIVRVDLMNDLPVHWNNSSHTFVNDTLWDRFASYYQTHKVAVINNISDQRKTIAKACPTNQNTTAGALLFIGISEIEQLPLFEVLHVQLDAFEENCQYPHGLLEYVESHAETVITKTKAYLEL